MTQVAAREPLKILLVSRCVVQHRIGGLERHARDLAGELSRRGNCVEVWTTAHEQGMATDEHGGVLTRFLADTPTCIHSPAFGHAVLERLRQPHQFDVLLAESGSATMTMRTLHPPDRPPAIIFMHGTWISEHLSVIAADTGPGKALRFLFKHLPGMAASIIRDRAAFRAERVVCVSEYVAEQCKHFYLVPEEKVRVIPNGIPLPPLPTDQSRLDTRRALGLEQDRTYLLCSGRLATDKAFDRAIRAFAVCSPPESARLLIVGGGPEEQRLRQIAQELRVTDRIIFTGPVPQDSVQAYYNASDILLLPSIRYEGHPYVLIEGAAAGLAVIASNRAGLGSELAGTERAILVKPGDVRELADAMHSLLSNPGLRAQLSANLRAHAEKRYTLEAMVDSVESVIAEILPLGKSQRAEVVNEDAASDLPGVRFG